MDGDGGAAGFDNLAWVDSAGPVGRGHRKAPVPRGVACAVAPPFVQALTIGRCTGTMRTSCMGTLTTRTTCEVGMGHIITARCFRSGVMPLVGTWLWVLSCGTPMWIRQSLEQKGLMSVRLAAASCLPSVATECRWGFQRCRCALRAGEPRAPGYGSPRQASRGGIAGAPPPAGLGTSPRPWDERRPPVRAASSCAGRAHLSRPPAGPLAPWPRGAHPRRRDSVASGGARARGLCGAMPAAGQWAPDGAVGHSFSPGPA